MGGERYCNLSDWVGGCVVYSGPYLGDRESGLNLRFEILGTGGGEWVLRPHELASGRTNWRSLCLKSVACVFNFTGLRLLGLQAAIRCRYSQICNHSSASSLALYSFDLLYTVQEILPFDLHIESEILVASYSGFSGPDFILQPWRKQISSCSRFSPQLRDKIWARKLIFLYGCEIKSTYLPLCPSSIIQGLALSFERIFRKDFEI